VPDDLMDSRHWRISLVGQSMRPCSLHRCSDNG
jgi:hypothetical protein